MIKIIDAMHEALLLYKRQFIKNPRILDATCGNGFDTLFLIKNFNKSRIHATDIQLDAVWNTYKLINKYSNNFTIFHDNFININPKDYDLVIFNLGYLPGGNKQITTNHQDTMQIIKSLTEEINNNSNLVIMIAVYPGHQEGKVESDMLDDYLLKLDSKLYLVSKYLNYNRPTSPYLITISKNPFEGRQ